MRSIYRKNLLYHQWAKVTVLALPNAVALNIKFSMVPVGSPGWSFSLLTAFHVQLLLAVEGMCFA
jgi:hypothetical protein